MKTNRIISIFALASLLFASCNNNEIAVYEPEDVVAPVLLEFAGCTLDIAGENLVAKFTPADFHIQVPVNYSFVAISGESRQEVKSSIDPLGTITMTQKDLNTALLNLNATPEVAFSAEFRVVASIQDDKGAVIGSTHAESNGLTVEFTPYSADLLDVDVYDHVWIIGAGESIGAWGFDTIEQFLYDYESNGVYTGIIDYQNDASGGWKLTGVGGWSDDCNWGLDGSAEAPEKEAGSINLISDGGSSDIKIYGKRFYMWSFDRNALKLTKQYAFDNIGLVGTINGWNPGDATLKMQYNATTHKFFIDYTFAAGDQFKFTCDDTWDLNFGVGCAQGGDNIIAESAGSVRVYLDLNKKEYELNAAKYGTEEEGTIWSPGEKTEYPEELFLIGDYCGWNWDNAHAMVKVNGSKAKYWDIIYITSANGFKYCSQRAWVGDFTSLDNNIGFTVSDGNCHVSDDDFYLVAVDFENSTVSVERAKVYGIGDCFGSWDAGLEQNEFAHISTYDDGITHNYLGTYTGAAGNLRMYAASDYYNTDWWRMEFNLYDGKVVFRGDNGDQAAVPMAESQGFAIDFNARTYVGL